MIGAFKRRLSRDLSFAERRKRDRRMRRRLRSVERLEDRRLLATLTVSNLDDSGNGSLRAAIEAANANSEADQIEFSMTGTINLTSGELLISNPLTINGPGADQLTVDAGGNSRIFNVNDSSNETINVEISGLTLTGGHSEREGEFLSGSGGAIRSEENLTVVASTMHKAERLFPTQPSPVTGH